MIKVLLLNPVSQEMGLEKYFQIPPLSLMQVASLFPENYKIEFWDEVHKKFDFEGSYDLVCITAMTHQAKRAYQISSSLKDKGIKTILGGMHPSVLPEEAIKYSSSVVVGEAEKIFSQVLSDFENQNLKKIYKAPISDEKDLIVPFPKRDILNGKRYITKQVVQVIRGCPFKCNFCTVTPFFGNHFRKKPMDLIIKEIDSLPNKLIVFLDDDLFADLNYAKTFLNYLKERNKKWVSQATLRFAEDISFVKLVKKAGCLGLFIGLETFPHKERPEFQKNKKIKNMESAFKLLQDQGILVEGSFVFGFDEDREDIFEKTVKFVKKVELPSATFNILTPYPGSEIYEKFEKEGRIITKDWEKYNHNEVVFLPKNMSPEKLYEGWAWARKETYSLKSIFKRVMKNKDKLKNFAYNILRKIPNDRL